MSMEDFGPVSGSNSGSGSGPDSGQVPVRIAFGLGSNLGDRKEHLTQAVDSIAAQVNFSSIVVSSIYETDPVGGPDQDDYLNAVAVVDLVQIIGRRDLLRLIGDLEAAAGRVREERWGPRTLDVDVLSFGAQVSDAPELTLPHPRAALRAFVLIPWNEVDPEYVIPASEDDHRRGWTVSQHCDALSDGEREGVRLRLDLGALT